MVAVDIRLRDNMAMDTSASADTIASELIESADAEWLRELVDALDREVRTAPLDRLVSLWDLSNAAAARLFGVSRQAFAKWLASGPPADRVDDITAVDNITTFLDRYVKRERIPAVVRRPAAGLSERSLIEALQDGDYDEAADFMRRAFDLRRIQP